MLSAFSQFIYGTVSKTGAGLLFLLRYLHDLKPTEENTVGVL